jgi:hypothetical protein
MSLSDFIREEFFGKRLARRRVLVIYDPEGRYETVARDLGDEHCSVIDASKSPLGARAKAWKCFRELGADETARQSLVLYTHNPSPKTKAHEIADPFRAFAIAGAEFPKGAGDDFREICRNYLPDRVEEIEQLFSSGSEPTFEMVDSLRTGGVQAPRLKAIFGTDNVKEIFLGFLCPTDRQREELEKDKGWPSEFRALAQNALGFAVNGSASKPDTLRAKLWQFVLFSEFAADLPGKLPEELETVPRADRVYITLINSLCERLRESAHQDTYAMEAEAVSVKLQLDVACGQIREFGRRDTFAFEERSFLARFSEEVAKQDWEAAGSILEGRIHSLWANHEERQLLWTIARYAYRLLQKAESVRLNLKDTGASGKALTEFYLERFVEIDTTQRLLEQAISEAGYDIDEVTDVIEAARKEYRALVNEVQDRLFKVVASEGWPFQGVERNTRTFDRAVGPALERKERVVYILVDGLRYEFGAQLDQELAKYFRTEIKPACALLPCVTRFGMASLLPQADTKLRIQTAKNGKTAPFLDGKEIKGPAERLEAIRSYYGDRCDMRKLEDLLKGFSNKGKATNLVKSLKDCDLLVVRSQEIDHQGESQSDYSKSNQTREIQAIIRLIRKLAEHTDYQWVVIATDHGFFWIDDLDAGDAISPPSGDWALETRRCCLGSGDTANRVVSFTTAELSIPTEYPTYIVPKHLAVFRSGGNYFHEGLSFQESLVPVLSVDLSSDKTEIGFDSSTVELNLSYKQGKARKVFTLRPSIEITAFTSGLGFGDSSYRFRLEVVQGDKEVGKPTSNPNLDPTTGLLSIQPGPESAMKVTLSLQEEGFEGDFEVRAIDPETGKAIAKLKLNFEPQF